MTTEEFISLYADGDVGELALRADRWPGVDMPFALRQIAGRQAAARKLPRWAQTAGLEYSARLPLEQCSSEATALEKRQIIAKLTGNTDRDSLSMADLTGGMGVDFSFIAPLFGHATYIERDESLCLLARHNMPLLGLPHATIIHGDGDTFLEKLESSLTLIYADPARRTMSGRRAYAIADCQPDIGRMLPLIMSRCRYFIAKLSPMLGLKAVAESLAPYVSEIHLIEADGECKETVAVMEAGKAAGEPTVHCHTPQGELVIPIAECGRRGSDAGISAAQGAWPFLYVPAKSLAKADCSPWTERRYGVESIAADSHLYLSHRYIDDFPGRAFSIESVCAADKRSLRALAAETGRANIAVRNFPLTADQLRLKLNINDGGDTFIFATTAPMGRHLLLVCKKAACRDTSHK